MAIYAQPNRIAETDKEYADFEKESSAILPAWISIMRIADNTRMMGPGHTYSVEIILSNLFLYHHFHLQQPEQK